MKVSGPEFVPFAWSLACSGRKRDQVREEMRSIIDQATQVVQSHFPKDRGYTVSVESPAGPSNGVQLAVRRGDFHASLKVERALDPKRRTSHRQWTVRVFGRAGSATLARAETGAHQLVVRGRQAGIGIGLAAFFAICGAVIGTAVPTFWLGGLLLVVVGLLVTTMSANVGSWLGEQLAAGRWLRAHTDASANPALDMDRKRWRALVRQLSSQKQALIGRQTSGSFRALPPAREITGPIPKMTTRQLVGCH